MTGRHKGSKIMRDWNKLACNLLDAEIKKKGLTYPQLSEYLKSFGIEESSHTLYTKIKRGAFSFAFFLEMMHIFKVTTLNMEEIFNEPIPTIKRSKKKES